MHEPSLGFTKISNMEMIQVRTEECSKVLVHVVKF